MVAETLHSAFYQRHRFVDVVVIALVKRRSVHDMREYTADILCSPTSSSSSSTIDSSQQSERD